MGDCSLAPTSTPHFNSQNGILTAKSTQGIGPTCWLESALVSVWTLGHQGNGHLIVGLLGQLPQTLEPRARQGRDSLGVTVVLISSSSVSTPH